jgi:methionine synthase II (cobalamin-independent)
MGDEIDAAMWRAMDGVQKIVESVMSQIKEIIRREAAALKAFVASAQFDDPYLKEDLNKSLDGFANTIETFIVAGVRRAVRKAFDVLKDDVDEKTGEALEGLDLLIVPDR